jgi:pyruvate/2-oxoglutarate dehydrogenase complex dihydrolipoamide acyltransferase (E2) component
VEAADLRDKPETEYVMAIIEVHVPQLSESVAEATLLNWHKKVGEAVARDENLIDIETDKVVLELPAPMQGVVVEIVKPDGSTVVSGEVIARIEGSDRDRADGRARVFVVFCVAAKRSCQHPLASQFLNPLRACRIHFAAHQPQRLFAHFDLSYVNHPRP